MARSWRRHTSEFAVSRNPGLRLLPAMLVGVAIAVAIAYFALGVRKSTPELPELVLRVEGQNLRLPDDTTCALAHRGCDAALAQLPPAVLRVVANPDTPFAMAAPALAAAADAHREALLSDGSGPVAVEPVRGQGLRDWANPNEDLVALRVRVIVKSDGFWLGTSAGKVLGADPRGPTVVPGPSGLDFAALSRKLRALRATLDDHETACGLLPALDITVGDVIRSAQAVHGEFAHVLLVVP